MCPVLYFYTVAVLISFCSCILLLMIELVPIFCPDINFFSISIADNSRLEQRAGPPLFCLLSTVALRSAPRLPIKSCPTRTLQIVSLPFSAFCNEINCPRCQIISEHSLFLGKNLTSSITSFQVEQNTICAN